MVTARNLEDILTPIVERIRKLEVAERAEIGAGGGFLGWDQVVIVGNNAAFDVDFTDVQAAIDSIVDASESRRYCVLTMPFENDQAITPKSFVDLIGVGMPTLNNTAAGGIITAGASNCIIANFRVDDVLIANDAITVGAGLTGFKMINIISTVGTIQLQSGDYYDCDWTLTRQGAGALTQIRVRGTAVLHNPRIEIIPTSSAKSFINAGEVHGGTIRVTGTAHPASGQAGIIGEESNIAGKFFGTFLEDVRNVNTAGSYRCIQAGGLFHSCAFNLACRSTNGSVFRFDNIFGFEGGRAERGGAFQAGPMFELVAGADGYWKSIELENNDTDPMIEVAGATADQHILGSNITGTGPFRVINHVSGAGAQFFLSGNRYNNGLAPILVGGGASTITGLDVKHRVRLPGAGTGTETNKFRHLSFMLDAEGEDGYVEFRVEETKFADQGAPTWVTTACRLYFMSTGTGTFNVDVEAHIAALGAIGSSNPDSAAFVGVAATTGLVTVLDITSAVGSGVVQLTAGDWLGIHIELVSLTTITEIHIVGVELEYVLGSD